MATVSGRRTGRPSAAERDALLAAANADFAAGRRIDQRALADRLGLSRTTIYRWFGTREELIGIIVANGAEAIIHRARKRARARGAHGLLEMFDAINHDLTANAPLRAYLAQEGESALRVLTRSDGIVQPRTVAAIQSVIDGEVDAGRYQPPLATPTLAYAIVRLGEAFLYNDVAAGVRGDIERLLEVEAALLGIAR
jgi:AcrR family transcriptional regulator